MGCAEGMPSLYPRVHDFQAIRRKLDPSGCFLNDRLEIFSSDKQLALHRLDQSCETLSQTVAGISGDRSSRGASFVQSESLRRGGELRGCLMPPRLLLIAVSSS